MKKYKPGIYDIENHEYHNSDGISRSGVMLFKKSPLHYWNKYQNPDRHSDTMTPQMIMGSAVHTYIMEPTKFYDQYYIEEKIDRRTKEGKDRSERLQLLNMGKQGISADMFDQIERMNESFHNNEYASAFLKDAQIEKSIYWEDVHSGVLCKARPDIWKNNVICDIKTTQDASLKAFQGSMAKYGYHIQAAMIQDGLHHAQNIRITDYIFIAIETVEPYAIGIYILDQDAIQKGHNEYKQIIKDFSLYQEKNLTVWPGYAPTTISLPAYYL